MKRPTKKDGQRFSGPRDDFKRTGSRDSDRFSGPRDSDRFSGSRDSGKFSGPRDSSKYSGSRDSSKFSSTRDSSKFSGSRDSSKFSGSRDSSKFSGSRDSGKFSGRDSSKHRGPRDSAKRPAHNEVKEREDFIENIQLEGRNAVLEAMETRPIDKILFKQGEIEGTLKVILAKARQKGIVVQEVTKARLDELSQTHSHQGVIAICPAKDYAEMEDIFTKAETKGQDPLIIILDGVTDPHNLGAIIRTAECAGAHGVIIPKHRSAPLSAVVAKTSAGAVEHVPVVRVTNLTSAIKELKERGLWVVGTETKANSLYESKLTGPLAVVIGSEGKGISRLVSENCDFTVSIPLMGEISSLNASVAAGVVVYEALRHRLMSQ